MEVIVKQSYSHYNRSLGMQIKNKDHYDRVCKEGNWVSYEQAQEIASKARQEKIKPYKISEESMSIIQHANNSKKKDGTIKLSDRAIDKLIERKAIGRHIPSYMELPTHYNKGGFYAPNGERE
jgi:hypothetical protein